MSCDIETPSSSGFGEKGQPVFSNIWTEIKESCDFWQSCSDKIYINHILCSIERQKLHLTRWLFRLLSIKQTNKKAMPLKVSFSFMANFLPPPPLVSSYVLSECRQRLTWCEAVILPQNPPTVPINVCYSCRVPPAGVEHLNLDLLRDYIIGF